MTLRHATALETISVVVPEDAVELFEAALGTACGTVGMFLDEATRLWTIEGVKDRGEDEDELASALALAAAVTGFSPRLRRDETATEGWLARTYASFPEQLVGRRFAIRGTHLSGPATPGRIVLTLDAGVAFGSGEHGSTRGCLRAFEGIAHRRPRRILDLGTGSGILAMAAAALLCRKVLATDVDPWSVRTAARNAALNGLGTRVRTIRSDGWSNPAIGGGYNLVFANILARPLCGMARHLARRLAPGGIAILAGLLDTQANWVLAAHRRHGLVLDRTLHEGRQSGSRWSTLVLRRRIRH